MIDLAEIVIRYSERGRVEAHDGLRKVEAGAGRTEVATSRLEREFEKANRMTALFKNAMVGLAAGIVGVGITGFVAQVRQVSAAVAAVGDEARRAGVGVEAFQELRFVAEQNRIGVDALTDGLKELNLRADEFIVTGGGSAAEAFMRLGLGADELRAKLRDPSALFSEIIGKLGDMDRAAQIRIADEVFGGTGGEKFVQLIEEGEAGIRDTIRRGRELGVVMSDDLVEKAAELDRRFNAVSATVGTALKGAIVEAATALSTFLDEFNGVIAAFNEMGPGVAGVGQPFFDRMNAEQRNALRLDVQLAGIGAGPNLYEGFGLNADGTLKIAPTAPVPLPRLLNRDSIPTDFAKTVGSGGGGGGGGTSSRVADAQSAADDYRKMIEGAREFIGEKEREIVSFGLAAEAAARLKHEQELLNRVANDNIMLSPMQRGEIGALAQQMAAAEEAARRMGDAYNTGKEAFGTFFTDIRQSLGEGASIWEAFSKAVGKALDSIADKLLGQAANGIWDVLWGMFSQALGTGGGSRFGTSLANPLGYGGTRGLYPGLATGGTVMRGGMTWVGERGPEILRLPAGAQVLNNAQSMALAANGNGMNDNAAPSRVMLELSPDLEARILAQSGRNTVDIVRANERANRNYRENGAMR